MPLKTGAGNIGANIRELEEHGSRPRSKDQILAIALHAAGVPAKRANKQGKMKVTKTRVRAKRPGR
jgi:hypothetical protein